MFQSRAISRLTNVTVDLSTNAKHGTVSVTDTPQRDNRFQAFSVYF